MIFLRSKCSQTVFSYELFNFIDFWTRNPMVIISRSPNLTLTLKWPTSYSFCIVTRKNVIICSWSYLETVYNIKLFWRSTYLTLTLKWPQIHSFCIITRKNVIIFLLVIFYMVAMLIWWLFFPAKFVRHLRHIFN